MDKIYPAILKLVIVSSLCPLASCTHPGPGPWGFDLSLTGAPGLENRVQPVADTPASGGSSQWRRFFVRKPPATQVHAECFSPCFVVSFTILQEAFVAQDSMIARVGHHAR